MRHIVRSFLALTVVALTASPAGGGDLDESMLRTLSWRSIGPARGGRVTAVTGVPGQPLVYYMGATGGGVWKTENAGNSWRPVSDGFFGTGSIGAIAVAESDPNVVYAGTGERDPRGNFSHGDGVYRSLDAGASWTHVGLGDTRQIARIRVHPQDHDLVYVAALGHIFGPNDERGVFRSRDGGATWERILFVDENTGAIDLAMDPVNPRILYAAFWQVSRTPWSLESGGPGSGLHKSTDGGDTWTKLERGLPRGTTGKIGVSVSPVDHDRVYAIVEAEDGGVFRSNDGGASFRRVNDDRSLRQRAWYYTHIYADTQDLDTVYVMNVSYHKSTDGGATYTTIRVPHSDNHDLWINPHDNRNMINGNDGGANVTFDGGASWSRQDNQPTAQFYHVITDRQFPYRVYGAQQDNSTVSISSRPPRWGRSEFYSVGGGESGYIAPRPDGQVVFAGSYGGLMTRYDHATRTSRNISVWPENPMGGGADVLAYRFQWTFPIVVSQHDPQVVYAAGNVVFKTSDEGQSWEAISPDLTTNDKSKQRSSGGPITKDNTSVEYYCTVFALAESPHDPDVLWAGSDDGLVHVTRDGGATWTNVTPAGLGEWSTISQIDVSPHAPGTAYLAVNRYRLDDFTPYIFVTSDDGATWRRITHGIGGDAFVRAVREDPVAPGLLYAGTETGVWFSLDGGEDWQSLQLDLPRVPVTDLVVHGSDIVIATQGRSFWILDDVTPLRGLSNDVSAMPAFVFIPRPAHRVGWDGVRVHYFLGEEIEGPVTIKILDPDGEEIRTFASDAEEGPRPSAEPGMNLFVWDMRYPGATDVPGAVMWGGSTRGPLAVPGEYEVVLSVGDRELEEPFEIHGDHRLETTQAEYETQFDLLIEVRDAVSRAHDAVNRIRVVRSQVETALEHAKGHEGHAMIETAAEPLLAALTEIEEAIIQTRSKSSQDPLNFPVRLNDKIAALNGVIARNDAGPTSQSRQVLDDLMEKLNEQLDRLEQEVTGELVPAFNDAVQEAAVPAVRD